MGDSKRPVALVTGGAIRVGGAISLGLAEAGYDVVINYRTSEAAARELQLRIEALGRRALIAQGDVSNPADVALLADMVHSRVGRLDMLVNSASIFPSGDLMEISVEEWDEVMAVNLRGPFLTLRAFGDLLKQSKGSVVNLVDLSALRPWVTYPHHSVSKAALLQLTRVAARAVAPHVRVNAIAPGHVLSPPDMSSEDAAASQNRVPLDTLGTPEDVVRTILFLAQSPFITGDVIVVDGGRNLT